MTKPNKFAGLVAASQPQPAPAAVGKPERQESPPLQSGAPEPTVLPERMLCGRVPDSIFREFQKRKFEAEETLDVRRVTTEEALEALVRMIRTPELYQHWLQAIKDVQSH